MKKRIKIDSALLSSLIILTVFLYVSKKLYFTNRFWDNVLDFVGLVGVLKGTFLRMAARGHKKAHSRQGGSLVMTGPYRLVRNPMYFGSFLIGAGFVLIIWPWWSLPVFAGFFYMRFNRQIIKEEGHLNRLFGEEYASYCGKVPRLFPSVTDAAKMKLKEVFNLREAWSTKETRGLWGWPLLAVVLELFQESVVFGQTHPAEVVTVFLAAVLAFFAGLGILYRYG